MDINFELYKVFYHAAHTGSFSQAADRLFITQSAISQAIKNLETQLGCQLFYRKARNMELTQEGQLLFQHIEQSYHLIKAAENKILEIKNLEMGEIRMGVSDTICKHYLIPFIQEFNQKYPGIKFQVVNRTSDQLLHLLKTGAIDFTIATLPVNDLDISVQDFIEVEDVFIASPKFSSLLNTPVSLKTLSKYPILMLDKKSSTRRNMTLYLDSKGIELIPEIELESIDLLIEFARIGLGIAYVLKQSAMEDIRQGRLYEVQLTNKPPLRKLGICRLVNVPLSQTASSFLEALQSAISSGNVLKSSKVK